MRPCFICNSESRCTHREQEVELAMLTARRTELQAIRKLSVPERPGETEIPTQGVVANLKKPPQSETHHQGKVKHG